MEKKKIISILEQFLNLLNGLDERLVLLRRMSEILATKIKILTVCSVGLAIGEVILLLILLQLLR